MHVCMCWGRQRERELTVITGSSSIIDNSGSMIDNNNNNNFNDNRGQEGPIVKIRRIILTGVLYVGYSMHS